MEKKRNWKYFVRKKLSQKTVAKWGWTEVVLECLVDDVGYNDLTFAQFTFDPTEDAQKTNDMLFFALSQASTKRDWDCESKPIEDLDADDLAALAPWLGDTEGEEG